MTIWSLCASVRQRVWLRCWVWCICSVPLESSTPSEERQSPGHPAQSGHAIFELVHIFLPPDDVPFMLFAVYILPPQTVTPVESYQHSQRVSYFSSIVYIPRSLPSTLSLSLAHRITGYSGLAIPPHTRLPPSANGAFYSQPSCPRYVNMDLREVEMVGLRIMQLFSPPKA